MHNVLASLNDACLGHELSVECNNETDLDLRRKPAPGLFRQYFFLPSNLLLHEIDKRHAFSPGPDLQCGVFDHDVLERAIAEGVTELGRDGDIRHQFGDEKFHAHAQACISDRRSLLGYKVSLCESAL